MPEAPSTFSSTAAGCEPTLPSFSCSWSQGSIDAAWVHVSGEVDLATSSKLHQTLRDAQRFGRLVVLDLHELTFMDSSAVHVILDASADAGRTNGRLILVRGATHVERILTLTGARDQVEIIDLDPALPPAHALLSLARGSTRA